MWKKKLQLKITITGKAMLVNNETIGTTYIKVPIEIDTICGYVVIPNVDPKSGKKFADRLNARN